MTYKCIVKYQEDFYRMDEKELNELANKGWKLITVVTRIGTYTYKGNCEYIFVKV